MIKHRATHLLNVKYAWALAAAIGGFSAIPPAQAVEFDKDRTMILDGYIKSIDWSGSQLKLTFHWNDGFDGYDWVIIGPKVADLLKRGWTKDAVRVGDYLDAVVHPDKAGTETGELLRFYLNDGRTLETSAYGRIQVISPQELQHVFKNPADDPMAGYYGNTQDFYAESPGGPIGGNYSGRAWYNSDHTLTMYSIDLGQDGKYKRSLNWGTWWLQEYKGKWTRCMIFNFAPRPYCHSPVNFEKVGDKWQFLFKGRNAEWIEHRELQPGRN